VRRVHEAVMNRLGERIVEVNAAVQPADSATAQHR